MLPFVAWSDIYNNVHFGSRKLVQYRQETPAWLYDSKAVRLVLAETIWSWIIYFGRGQSRSPCPELLRTDWHALKKAADIHWSKVCAQRGWNRTSEHRAMARAVERMGGVLELYVAILWRYRLGESSPEIAEAVRHTPVCIRQRLARFRHIARRLGFDTEGPKPNCGPKGPLPQNRKWDWSQFEKLYYEEGKTPADISKITGAPRNTVDNVLKKLQAKRGINPEVPIGRKPKFHEQKFVYSLILEMVENGCSSKFIAQRLGCAHPTAKRAIMIAQKRAEASAA